jgi:hypothetical protein
MICCNPSLTLAAAKARTEIRLKPAGVHEPFHHDLLNAQKSILPRLGVSPTLGEVPEKGVDVSGSGHAAAADAPDVFTRLLRKFLSWQGENHGP